MELELENNYSIISTEQEIFLQFINSSNGEISLLSINKNNCEITKVQNPYFNEQKIIIKTIKVIRYNSYY